MEKKEKFKMTRNESGYYDETAYKGVMNMAKVGEIWSYAPNEWANRKMVLIIKNHGTLCTALSLLDEKKEGCIELRANGSYFTNPQMVQYIYNDGLGQKITTLPLDQFEELLEEIGSALGVTIYTRSARKQEEQEKIAQSGQDFMRELRLVFGADAVGAWLRINAYAAKTADSVNWHDARWDDPYFHLDFLEDLESGNLG